MSPEPVVRQLTSADGTKLTAQYQGRGPNLVVVVGAFSDRRSAGPIVAALADSFTVFTYDRRGRGDSGDQAQYETQREIEDLLAVLDFVGEAFVFGHSSGGALALETAAQSGPMRRLAVYEPPYAGTSTPGPEFGRGLDELVRSGRRSEAAERFLALTGLPDEARAAMKSAPFWPGMEALAHTLSRDLALGNGGTVPTERLARIAVPTLAMAGGNSAAWASAAVQAIAEAIPDSDSLILDGQEHAPAPDAITSVLARFFV